MTYVAYDSGWLVIQTWIYTFTAPLYWPHDLWQLRREKRAFATGIEAAWNYCATVWDRPYVDVWCQLIRTSRRPSCSHLSHLRNRFVKEFGQSHDFLKRQTRSKNPVLAAYAVQCFANPNLTPDEVFQRTETIQLRDWFHIVYIPLGEWASRYVEDHNRSSELLQSWDNEV